VIRASAGSGKTFQLTRRFLWLISQGVNLDTILATTFSRKAAGEILDRILSRLAEAVEDDASLDSLRALVAPQWDRAHCHHVLRHIIRHLHDVQIRTLDSFFVRVAQSLSFELGLPPGWTILEDDQDRVLRSLALSQLLQEPDRTRGWLHLLFKGEAVRTVSKQLQDLIRDDYQRVFLEAIPDAWNRLALRQTLSDAEVEQALAKLEAYPMVKLQTSLQQALRSDLERARSDRWAEFLKKGIAAKVAKGEQKYGRVVIPSDLVKLYVPLVDHARGVLLNAVIHQTRATYELFNEFDKNYQCLKCEAGTITFHDVTRYLRDYLRENGSISEAEWNYRTGFELRHLLLDEFQDTSALQWQVLEGFAKRICEKADGTFFCVGDVKQSIYAWRGSEPRIFGYLEESLPDVQTQPLDVSYRSSPTVIEVVNEFFEGLSQSNEFGTNREVWRDAIKNWCSRFMRHETARNDYPGYCCIVVKDAPQEATWEVADENENGDTLQSVENVPSVLLTFVREIYDASFQPTIGILVRKNEALEPIVAALRQAGLPVSQEGHNPVTASPAVQMILNVLRVADHPTDSAAALRVATSPLKNSVDRMVRDPVDDEAQYLRELSYQLRRRLLNRGYGDVIRELANDLAPHVPAEEHFWLEKLIEISSLYDDRPTARVRDFLTWLDHREVTGVEEARIRVMTIHGAKGLQFDVVFLPDLDAPMGRSQGNLIYARSQPAGPIDRVYRGVNQDLLGAGVFPEEVQSAYDQYRQRWIEEDLSVLYVAMTRAIYGLYMFVKPRAEGRSRISLSFSGLLCGILADKPPIQPGEIIFERGDPSWLSKLPSRQHDKGVRERVKPLNVILRKPSRSQRSLSWTAPHEAEGRPSVMSDPLRWEPSEALLVGTIIHIWLSRIRWLDQNGLPDERERQSTVVQILGSLDRYDKLDLVFKAVLEQPAIRDLLSLRSYRQPRTREGETTGAQLCDHLQNPRWELYLEQPFVIRDQGVYTRGQFDRIVVLYEGDQVVGADIVDFKTDNVGAEQLKDRIDFYRPQLEMYQRAASEWLHVPPAAISARLAFVRSGTVCRVC